MDTMPILIQYLLKLSVSLGVMYLFYQLVLRRITFYNWNRWYLLGYSLLSFLIPFINISPVLQKQEWTESNLVQWVPVFTVTGNGATPIGETVTASQGWQPWQIVMLVLATGIVIMTIRLLLQLWSFLRMVKKARLISIEQMKLYEVDASIIPFSFGNSIFVNPSLHTSQELEEIIRHEFVHVKQRHSIDIICAELLCLFNWYNPFAWMIRSSIRQNLEFIADNKVLQHGIDRKQYQYLLLKVMGNHQFSIANQFNFSSLKKRIAMMNKIKSAKVHLLRFLFVLPLLAVLLVSFREKIGRLLSHDAPATAATITEDAPPATPLLKTMYVAGKVVDQTTYAPMANIPLKVFANNKLIATLKTDAEGYYYLADDINKRTGEKPMYEILIDNPAYYRVNGGTTANIGNESGLYHTIFLASKKVKGRSIAYDLGIPATELLQASNPTSFVKAEIERISEEKIERNKKEKKISNEFLGQFPTPADWFTLYKGYIFSKEGKLMGIPDSIRFYIMDERSTYQEVNEKFRNAKELPQHTGSWRDGTGWTEINFVTDDFNKPAAPFRLMAAPGNVQKIPVSEFIHTNIAGKIVYINGRRTTTRGMNGWMLGKPGERKKNVFGIQQAKIANVYILHNDLADYYYPTAREVYWVELNNGVGVINRPEFTNVYTDTIPKKPNSKGYYVEIIGVGSDCTVIISDKNHKEVKRMLLNDWDAKEDYFVGLYGEILPPPPNEPPTPPSPPVPAIDPVYESSKKDFLKRNPDVKNIGWHFTSNNKNLVVKTTITKKDGSKEIYNFSDEADKAKAEKKYGALPFPDTAPPTPPLPVNDMGTPGVPPVMAVPPVAPAPPKPIKEEINITGNITISGIAAASKVETKAPKLSGTYEFIADTLIWVPLTRTLEFRGVSKEMKTGRMVGKFTVGNYEKDPYILINGKPFDLRYQSFYEYGKTLKVTFLDKERAMKKYGLLGKNGAIEVEPFGC